MKLLITTCQQLEKMEIQKRTVLKVRENQAVDGSNEIFWSLYLIMHVFFI
jgi:hypothetical protein